MSELQAHSSEQAAYIRLRVIKVHHDIYKFFTFTKSYWKYIKKTTVLTGANILQSIWVKFVEHVNNKNVNFG